MFGFRTKLPVSEEVRRWTDDGFARLEQILGRDRMLQAQAVLPDDRFFPDRYDGTKPAVNVMASRVANYMGLSEQIFTVEIYAQGEDEWREALPIWRGGTKDAAGLFFHRPEDGKFLVGIHAKQLADPLSLAATLAHELAHVILLGGGLMDPEARDMEPMTDLCTVFLGMGFFTASAAFQFKQWSKDRTQGWSTERKGYLPEPVWGYALARFAHERGERFPAWARNLPTNIKSVFMQSSKWFVQQ